MIEIDILFYMSCSNKIITDYRVPTYQITEAQENIRPSGVAPLLNFVYILVPPYILLLLYTRYQRSSNTKTSMFVGYRPRKWRRLVDDCGEAKMPIQCTVNDSCIKQFFVKYTTSKIEFK